MKNNNQKVILGIIKDALIADRTFRVIREATNVLAPRDYKGRYKPDYHYQGVFNAFLLMGVTDDDVKDTLFTVFSGESVSDDPIDELPEKIYVEWLSILASHYVEEKEGVVTLNP